MILSIPQTTLRSRVPYLSSTLPEPQNSSVFARLWFKMCSSAAKIPSGPPMPSATATSPMFSTLEYASRRLMSRCTRMKNAATATDNMPKMSNNRLGKSLPMAWQIMM
ncbi:Uncharacterised protein [Shigella sonnei]|nr:Uncharacterised protein [Shigella sonnei]CSG14563.1 Uncharacterised protein [Shigella sonnei]CSG41373.1 Uncharacterised protein [Shigella sonnei]